MMHLNSVYVIFVIKVKLTQHNIIHFHMNNLDHTVVQLPPLSWWSSG